MISEASALLMGVPLRASAKSTIQRNASAACRSDGHFERHLIGRAADAAGFGFDARLGIVHGALQNFDRIRRRILFDELLKRTVNDALRGALLAGEHDGVDEARHERALKFSIPLNGTSGGLTTT